MRKLAHKIKRVIRVLIGKDFFLKAEYVCPKERVGSIYGGWDIASGKIDKNSIVYSFGVGKDVSFDVALIDKFNLHIYAFDPTPKSIDWVRNQELPSNFVFFEYGLADSDGDVVFNPPKNPGHVSHTILAGPITKAKTFSVPVKRLSTIMQELRHNRIDILKMDIEGAEYGVIDDIEKSDIRPQQILVEFHHRFPNVGIKKTKASIQKIKNLGYHLFSVSASGEEYSFIRKDI